MGARTIAPQGAGASIINRTLLWGGLLLVAGSALQIITVRIDPAQSYRGGAYTLPNYYLPAAVSATLVLAGCLVFALGLRAGGSVVGRSRWGRGALIGFGVCHACVGWSGVLGQTGFVALAQLGVLFALLEPLFAAAAALVIARQRALPGRWWMLPGIVLVIVLLAMVVLQVPGVMLPDLSYVAYVAVEIAPWMLLGGAAVVLARRTAALVSVAPRVRGRRRRS